MTEDIAKIAGKLTKAQRFAFWLSAPIVRECVISILRGDRWEASNDGQFARIKPYPMGYWNGDSSLYYANGWGRHWVMWPWERWLVSLAVREYLKGQSQ